MGMSFVVITNDNQEKAKNYSKKLQNLHGVKDLKWILRLHLGAGIKRGCINY